MAKVYFGPYRAIKYIGSKAKDLHTSLARPKPRLKKGDIVIVDRKTAFNLAHKGFGEFEDVDSIEFVKTDVKIFEKINDLVLENSKFKTANDELNKESEDLNNENIRLTALVQDLETKLQNSYISTFEPTEIKTETSNEDRGE